MFKILDLDISKDQRLSIQEAGGHFITCIYVVLRLICVYYMYSH